MLFPPNAPPLPMLYFHSSQCSPPSNEKEKKRKKVRKKIINTAARPKGSDAMANLHCASSLSDVSEISEISGQKN